MKTRVWFSLILTIVLTLSLAAVAPPLMARTISVDGDPSDWYAGALTYNDNTGQVNRVVGSPAPGEYDWADNSGDERAVFASPDPRVDLEEFRVTGDADNIYFLACMNDIPSGATSGDGAPQVQVAVDSDQDGSGSMIFMNGADTFVHSNAYWETLLMTRFGSGNSNVRTWATAAGTPTDVGAAAISDTEDCIEFSVPWTQFGFSGVPTDRPLRMTVAVFRADANDDTQDLSGYSDVLDAVTNYGDPCDMANTWVEVSDGVVDYHFEVYFEPGSGEVMSPLLISEVMAYPNNDPNGEWVQIYNAWGSTLNLASWKIGDEESCTATCTEGMYQFPSGYSIGADVPSPTVPPYRVVAATNTGFQALGYSSCSADFEITHSDTTPDMTEDGVWCPGGTFNLNNNSEQVLLLDPYYTIMDGLVYGSASLPGHNSYWPNNPDPAPPLGPDQTLERSPVNADTNDCGVDFSLVTGIGSPCETPTAVKLQNLAASAGGLGLMLPAALGLAVVLAGGVFLVRRRK